MKLLKKRTVEMLGRKKDIRPIFMDNKFGDGGQWVKITTPETRPNYFIIRIDSDIEIRSHDFISILNRRNGIFKLIEHETILEPYRDRSGLIWEKTEKECINCGIKLYNSFPEDIHCIQCRIDDRKFDLKLIKKNITSCLETALMSLENKYFERVLDLLTNSMNIMCEFHKSCMICPVSKITGFVRCSNTLLEKAITNTEFILKLNQNNPKIEKYIEDTKQMIINHVVFVELLEKEFYLWYK